MNNQYRKIARLPYHSARGIKNVSHWAAERPMAPRQLWFEITDRCNCQCQFCNIWRAKPTHDILTPKQIETIFSDRFFSKLKIILLSGGEPFLRNDLEEILLRIGKSLPATPIVVGTNSTLPERVINVAKAASRNNIRLGIGVSLDGIAERHDQARGVKGLFGKVDWLLRELTMLRAASGGKISISIGFVLTDTTLSEIERVKEYAKNLNIPFHVQWYNEAEYYKNIGKHLLSNKENIIKAIRLLPPSIINEMGIKSLVDRSIKFPCFAMHSFCLLKCNGEIAPCFNFWDTRIGTVKKNSPSSIWNSPKAIEARRMVHNCQGCLNACGIEWSHDASIYPTVLFHIRNLIKSII